ncbi:four helix bundle protein [Kaistella antarctica]|uniref:30S ribosomal protein S23 n=1 Tax=Kaistella antarctica TaxID=266748 RepID=A0A448NTF1_9FLAO|nr:four helix bundle protein [Kaistella antarctica]KEY18132.1 30S ribosomal protein S23 [Kaistella antarctica]SEV82978.1 four helix bundle protein [Kaistella antarctica]VEI00723.1 four helix bundle protein [Kaistella antarctica]
MPTIKNFEDLEIWQKSRILCQNIDRHCLKNNKFQKHDQNQIDRSSASASVMDNIAEGFEREGNREFANFLTMSKGSAGEVRSQLIRAFDRNYLDESTFLMLKDEAINMSKKLSGFINYLKNSEDKGNKFNRNKENE